MDIQTALTAAREWSLDEMDAVEVIDVLASALERVQDAWRAVEEDQLPQGFGWPGDLYDALEALEGNPAPPPNV